MTAWYETSFGREYLDLYAHRGAAEARADIRAIVRLFGPAKDQPLLDLCCGACRHLLALREMGFSQLVGIDLSRELLQVAAEELEKAVPAGTRAHVCLVCSDMRLIPYQAYFGTVLSLFTSFGYFDTDQQNQAVFDAVFGALKQGGKFLIDYLNRDYVIAHLVERDEQDMSGRHVLNTRHLTDDCRRVEKRIAVLTGNGRTHEYLESVRLYTRSEMVSMLSRSGFAGVLSYGTLDGQPFAPGSKRLVLIAEKRTC
jgi:SAM-dependent methyltransferase